MAVGGNLLLVDPSVLLAQAGIRWLETEHEATRTIVVSAAFYNSLQALRGSSFVRLSPSEEYRGRIGRLRELLEGVQLFSHEDARLPDPLEAVKRNVLAGHGPDAAILADEWAYLQSQSWMVARRQTALNGFRDAGAAVIQCGRRLRNELLNVVIPGQNVPASLSISFLAKVGAKWLVVGGATAAGGWMGGPVGGVLGLPAVPLVRAFDS